MASYYTLWQFTSPSNQEVVRSMKLMNLDDKQYQHKYQKILWQGEANGSNEAWLKCGHRK